MNDTLYVFVTSFTQSDIIKLIHSWETGCLLITAVYTVWLVISSGREVDQVRKETYFYRALICIMCFAGQIALQYLMQNDEARQLVLATLLTVIASVTGQAETYAAYWAGAKAGDSGSIWRLVLHFLAYAALMLYTLSFVH